jgi:hypothetical protein
MQPHGHFAWNEFLARDVEAAKAYYAATLDWSYEPMAMGGGGTYWVATSAGVAVAGVMAMPDDVPASVGPHWFPYVEVDDVDARCRAAVAAGGSVRRGPWDIPGVGRLAILMHRTGGAVGVMTSERSPQA